MKHIKIFETFEKDNNIIINQIKKHLIEPTLMDDEIEYMYNDFRCSMASIC